MENTAGGTSKMMLAAIMVVIVCAAGFVYVVSNPTILSDLVTPTNQIQGIDSPLEIVGDEEMTEAVEEFGFQGTGSQDDPYVIENLSIVSERNCIDIRNVEASFEIRNCQLSVTTLDYWGICIYIGGCVDASVIDCRVEGGSSGIELFDTHRSIVSGCDVKYSFFGINISVSQESEIEYNRIYNTTWGITFVASNHTTVGWNEIQYNEIGVFSQWSFRCFVHDNNITHNSYGMELQGQSQNWTISSNNMLYNSEIGIRLDETTSQMIVYMNHLGWNTANNAWDDGLENMWNFDGKGNSWHDYSGIGAYTIPGSTGSVDLYPQHLEG